MNPLDASLVRLPLTARARPEGAEAMATPYLAIGLITSCLRAFFLRRRVRRRPAVAEALALASAKFAFPLLLSEGELIFNLN